NCAALLTSRRCRQLSTFHSRRSRRGIDLPVARHGEVVGLALLLSVQEEITILHHHDFKVVEAGASRCRFCPLRLIGGIIIDGWTRMGRRQGGVGVRQGCKNGPCSGRGKDGFLHRFAPFDVASATPSDRNGFPPTVSADLSR